MCTSLQPACHSGVHTSTVTCVYARNYCVYVLVPTESMHSRRRSKSGLRKWDSHSHLERVVSFRLRRRPTNLDLVYASTILTTRSLHDYSQHHNHSLHKITIQCSRVRACGASTVTSGFGILEISFHGNGRLSAL
jgi:hypothetical protein